MKIANCKMQNGGEERNADRGGGEGEAGASRFAFPSRSLGNEGIHLRPRHGRADVEVHVSFRVLYAPGHRRTGMKGKREPEGDGNQCRMSAMTISNKIRTIITTSRISVR